MKNLRPVLALIVLCLITAPLIAKEGKGHSKHADKHASKHAGKEDESGEKGSKQSEQHESHGKFTITQKEREVFHSYVNNEHAHPNRSLPPGLAKKVARGKGLPPGWQKKCAVGQVMPPEVLEVACPLPKDLILKLPPSPVGTITVAVQGKVVRLLEKTKEILDILDLPTPIRKRG